MLLPKRHTNLHLKFSACS